MAEEMKQKSLGKLARSNVEQADLEGVLAEIRQASDRTAAIVLSSWVERSLEQSILAVLFRNDDALKDKLLGPGGPLNGFYGKTQLGLALGIFDEVTRDNLDVIRNIRNAFAHSAVPLTFETKQVLDEVARLNMRTAEMPDKLGEELSGFSSSRKQFTLMCVMFAAMSRLRAAGFKADIISRVANAIRTAAETAEISPELLQRIKTASELEKPFGDAAQALKKLDID
jgi:hypothetical protein